MRKLITIIVSVFVSVFLVITIGLNIVLYCQQRKVQSIEYNEICENIYDFYDEDYYDDYASEYNKRMYVSKENSDWLISDYEDGISINKYLGKDKNIVIPETLDGKRVLCLDCNYFRQPGDPVYEDEANIYFHYHNVFDNTNIESITIPSGVKRIKYFTFSGITMSPEPVLKKVTVSKDNPVFFSNDDGDIGIRENNEIIYSYKLEERYHNIYSKIPYWIIVFNYMPI